jgi:hypothetical protein
LKMSFRILNSHGQQQRRPIGAALFMLFDASRLRSTVDNFVAAGSLRLQQGSTVLNR